MGRPERALRCSIVPFLRFLFYAGRPGSPGGQHKGLRPGGLFRAQALAPVALRL